jgi:SecD/SecF fusion protein
MVAAFLTLVGYSVNDTIVVFDRIRDTRLRFEPLSWSILNNSVNAMFSRTLLTGLTTWLVAVILYGVGGKGVHGFAFVMLTGVLVGTYSSIYIASPLLMWLGGPTTPARGPAGTTPPPAAKSPDKKPGTGKQHALGKSTRSK